MIDAISIRIIIGVKLMNSGIIRPSKVSVSFSTGVGSSPKQKNACSW